MSEVISPTGRVHLRWALTDGVGPLLFSRTLIYFGDAEKALGASAAQLEKVHGIGAVRAEQIARARDAAQVDEEIEAAARHEARIICRADPEYPPGLREIPDAPIVLYVKGELRDTDAVALAVVGTRRCSIYGSEQARRFGELLAGAGFTVVSGLARGIDAFAHHGALDAGGRSLAVLGSGLTDIYPPENRALADKLLSSGAWVSELPMRAAVRRENFPSRNRIIAGMTLGTLVVEAPLRSGALITARLASDYNREVFAVPGRLQEPQAEGSNAFIRDGIAKLVTSLDDIFNELGEVGARLRSQAATPAETATTASAAPADDDAGGPRPDRGAPADRMRPGEISSTASTPATAPRPALTLSPAERRVYEIIGYEAILQDVVLRAAELPPGEVLAAITTLELKGLIRRLPGNLVVRRGIA